MSLCKHLVGLMDGEILLDEEYDSGVEGCPGSRFMIRFHEKPTMSDDLITEALDKETMKSKGHVVYDGRQSTASLSESSSSVGSDGNATPDCPSTLTKVVEIVPELPKTLKVLFVDDDFILRKLFIRTIRRVAPDWTVREAANGETALQLVESETFDLVFMDQYMASVEKQLLGTETVKAMRSKDVQSIICGLSANDMEKEFLQAGANAFMMKPFPCENAALEAELIRIVYSSPLKSASGRQMSMEL